MTSYITYYICFTYSFVSHLSIPFFGLGGTLNLQRYLQSFALSSHIHISLAGTSGKACGLLASNCRFWYVFPMSMIMQLFWLSQKLNHVVCFLMGILLFSSRQALHGRRNYLPLAKQMLSCQRCFGGIT